jgi:hypothetical protein
MSPKQKKDDETQTLNFNEGISISHMFPRLEQLVQPDLRTLPVAGISIYSTEVGFNPMYTRA